MRTRLRNGSAGLTTQARILAAAERLFAERGYHGVSLRQIGDEANAQIALINYHFGTKDMLYRAVFESRLNPVSERRRAALATALACEGGACKDGRPMIEAVLDAFARSWIELSDTEDGRFYTRLIAREVNDPQEAERGILSDLLDPIARDFLAAMERSLPDHDRADVHWAYHFFVGMLTLTMANPKRVNRLSGNLFENQPHDVVISRLVAFVASALRADGRSSTAIEAAQGGSG